MRLQYDDTKKKINTLKHALADLEDDMVPGQNESDKDRYLIIRVVEVLHVISCPLTSNWSKSTCPIKIYLSEN